MMNAVSAFLYNFLHFSQFILYELAVSHFPNHSSCNKTRNNNRFTKGTKMLLNHLMIINSIWKHISFSLKNKLTPKQMFCVFFPNEVSERTRKKKRKVMNFWIPTQVSTTFFILTNI